jgi:hypothetical protein
LDYGGAHVINGGLYIVSCFKTKIYCNTVIWRSTSNRGRTVITKKTRGCNWTKITVRGVCIKIKRIGDVIDYYRYSQGPWVNNWISQKTCLKKQITAGA